MTNIAINPHLKADIETRKMAWEKILNQIETLQIKMKEYGVEMMFNHHSPNSPDFAQGSQGARFLDGKNECTFLKDAKFGPWPHHIELVRVDGKDTIDTKWSTVSASMWSAATRISGNIFGFINATNDSGMEIRDFELRIEENGRILVETVSKDSEQENRFVRNTWPVPVITNTIRQLNGWLEVEARTLREDMQNRLFEILRQEVFAINQEYPGLELTMYGKGHGSGEIGFRMNYEDRIGIDFSNMRNDVLEDNWPGLAMQLDGVIAIYAAYNDRFDDLAAVRVETGLKQENKSFLQRLGTSMKGRGDRKQIREPDFPEETPVP